MVAAVSLLGLLVLPQVQADPMHVEIPGTVVITVRSRDLVASGIPVAVKPPGQPPAACGVTGADGRINYTPAVPGRHVFEVVVDGVRHLVVVTAAARRPRWLLAFAVVPLGLALCWRLLRPARGRRGP